jgi:hypothetical protein
MKIKNNVIVCVIILQTCSWKSTSFNVKALIYVCHETVEYCALWNLNIRKWGIIMWTETEDTLKLNSAVVSY